MTYFGGQMISGHEWSWLGLKLKADPNCHQLQQGGGGGPRVVVSTAAFHARVRGSVTGLGGLKETQIFFPIHV